MNEKHSHFPEINEFYNKFCAAVQQSGKEQKFLAKWGLNRLSEVYDLLNNNVQGGYSSHRESILSGRPGGSVLSIGPGMGFCAFFLAELYDTVFVAEPDGENCSLLQSILAHYPTAKDKNKCAGDIVSVIHACISITGEAVKYWDTKAMLMKKRKKTGSILNFDIRGAGELKDILDKKVSRIYLHKVLSSLSISIDFAGIISQCRSFLPGDGELTWSEPGYIFTDILQVEDGAPMDSVLGPIFEKHHMNFSVKTYEVANEAAAGESERPLVENWAFIRAWRLTDEKR